MALNNFDDAVSETASESDNLHNIIFPMLSCMTSPVIPKLEWGLPAQVPNETNDEAYDSDVTFYCSDEPCETQHGDNANTQDEFQLTQDLFSEPVMQQEIGETIVSQVANETQDTNAVAATEAMLLEEISPPILDYELVTSTLFPLHPFSNVASTSNNENISCKGTEDNNEKDPEIFYTSYSNNIVSNNNNGAASISTDMENITTAFNKNLSMEESKQNVNLNTKTRLKYKRKRGRKCFGRDSVSSTSDSSSMPIKSESSCKKSKIREPIRSQKSGIRFSGHYSEEDGSDGKNLPTAKQKKARLQVRILVNNLQRVSNEVRGFVQGSGNELSVMHIQKLLKWLPTVRVRMNQLRPVIENSRPLLRELQEVDQVSEKLILQLKTIRKEKTRSTRRMKTTSEIPVETLDDDSSSSSCPTAHGSPMLTKVDQSDDNSSNSSQAAILSSPISGGHPYDSPEEDMEDEKTFSKEPIGRYTGTGSSILTKDSQTSPALPHTHDQKSYSTSKISLLTPAYPRNTSDAETQVSPVCSLKIMPQNGQNPIDSSKQNFHSQSLLQNFCIADNELEVTNVLESRTTFKGNNSKIINGQTEISMKTDKNQPQLKTAWQQIYSFHKNKKTLPSLTELMLAGKISPGENVLSLHVNDQRVPGTLLYSGMIQVAGGAVFNSVLSWCSAWCGGRSTSRQAAYKRVYFKGQTLLEICESEEAGPSSVECEETRPSCEETLPPDKASYDTRRVQNKDSISIVLLHKSTEYCSNDVLPPDFWESSVPIPFGLF